MTDCGGSQSTEYRQGDNAPRTSGADGGAAAKKAGSVVATGTRVMVIREGDGVIWYDRQVRGYLTGRVVEVRYEQAEVVEARHDLSHAALVDLIDIRVVRPKVRAGDIVVSGCPTGRIRPEAQQGVVQPVRLSDGFRWYSVVWENGYRSRHRVEDLLRVPVSAQHPVLWELAKIASN